MNENVLVTITGEDTTKVNLLGIRHHGYELQSPQFGRSIS